MEVLLLGTGSGAGWPNPFCRCGSCSGARSRGEARAQSCALVDGTVLLDAGPDAPLAASRHGTDLAGVRLLLLTHAHWDHVNPSLLVTRQWAGCAGPLTIAGPEAAVSAYADWTAPGADVELVTLLPGDRITVGGYDVVALPAAHGDATSGVAVLYDVTAPDGGRLLYATDTGPLPVAALEAAAGRAYDVVLLDETFGDLAEHPPDHLDLRTFADAVQALRANGAVTSRTRVVAIHLDHGNPPDLASRLSAIGAEVLPDGARLSGEGRRVLVLGGARSGKSAYAESRLAGLPDVTYVATGPASDDADWAARVAAHRARRPVSWHTVETTDVAAVLRSGGGTLLVDCITLWLAAAMDEAGCWSDPPEISAKELQDATDELVAAWRDTTAYVVAVANLVGSGVHPATASGRRFRDEMGTLTARLAAESDEVWQVTAGLPQRLT